MIDFKQRTSDREELVQVLENAGAQIRGNNVQCPFHEDKNPSGSIYESGGHWRYKCHSCNFLGDVMDVEKELGTNPSQSFSNNNPKTTKAKIPKETKPKKTYSTLEDLVRIVWNEAHYIYTDIEGDPTLCVFRHKGKRFSQYTKDDKGLWSSGGYEGTQPLYNMHNLPKAETVFITEGEKDCDALNAIGLTATTAPMGADGIKTPLESNGKAGKTDWSPLAGKRVVLWGDNDEVGRRHMERVHRVLMRLTPAPEVYEISDADRQGHKDAADWIEAYSGTDIKQEFNL